MKVYKFTFSLFGINTYVTVDEATRSCAIIDPGMINEEERGAMLNFVAREKLTVTHVINTHMHIDHAISSEWCRREFNVPLLAHEGDFALGLDMKRQAQMFGIPVEVLEPRATRYLQEGDVIEIGEGRLEVLHVPGHSPGSVVLYDPAGGYIIAGDVLFEGSIGRTDLPGGNHRQLLSGIKEKLFALPDTTAVHPGHGPATTIGRERLSNPFLR